MSDPRQPLDALPDPLPLPGPSPGRAPFDVTIRPPGSKSLTNRALLLAALADGCSTLRGALTDADDAQRMITALRALGVRIELSNDRVEIVGVAGRWRPVGPGPVRLDLGNAGTATRFLAAAALCSPVPIEIDGNARMRERPIGELAEALIALGMRIECLGRAGYPPLRLTPPAGPMASAARGLELRFGRTRSSQFLSAVLLVAPWIEGGLTLHLSADPTSRPYLEMSVALLSRLGATVRTSEDLRVIRVSAAAGRGPRGLSAFDLEIEPDASGATYFWAAAALVEGARCRVPGLASSLQGDAAFADLLARMGARVSHDRESLGGAAEVRGPRALEPIMADMGDMPDAAMTLAVVCAFARGSSVLRGLRTLRDKETDRIAAMQAELARLGVGTSVQGDDTLTITPPRGGVACAPDVPPVVFETYDDHRMAMSMALASLRRPKVFIRDPGCVRKTYPGFWADFARLVE